MKVTSNKKVLCVAVAAACLAGETPATLAAEKNLVLEEVIVTATKQEETINNVGASILAVGSKQIDDMGFRNMQALVASMPNVNVQEAPTGTKLTVRGVGTPPTGGASSSVATFIDGVYQGNTSQTNNILVDMQRVEILRGPQGTLFGKNSISGVFNLITARPTRDFEGMVDLRAGNMDSREGTLVLSGPLTDSLAARFVAYNQHTGDYIDNSINVGSAGGTDKESYRLSLTWDVDDNTTLWTKYQHDHNKLNAAVNQMTALDPIDAASLSSVSSWLAANTDTRLDGNFATGTDTQYGYHAGLNPETVLVGSRDLLALNFNHIFDNDYELNFTAGYDRNKVFNRGNTSQDYPLLTIYLDTDGVFETKNMELRLSSPSDDQFHYTVGAYGEQSRYGIAKGDGYINFDFLAPTLNYIMTLPYPYGAGVPAGLLSSNQALTPALITDLGVPYGWNKTTSLAGYAQGTYDFNEEWSLTFGIRYADDKIVQTKRFGNRTDINGNPLFSTAAFADINPTLAAVYSAIAQSLFGTGVGIGMPGDPDFKETHHDRAILPAGKLEFRPNPDQLYYLSAQTGYKNGGFSTDGLGYPTPFNKEKSLAFELGGKWTLMSGRGQLNAAVFHTDFKDLQVAAIDPTSGGVLFKNAAEAYSEGIELSTRWKLTEALSVGAQYAYLNAKYKSFPGAPGNIDQSVATQAYNIANSTNLTATQDLKGKPLPNAPENTASLSVDYSQPITGALEFQSNLQVTYTDANYTDLADSEQLKADSATLVDLRLALNNLDDKWTVALIGHNLTNDRGQLYGTASSIVSKGTTFGAIRQPASYWLQLVKRF